jgi:hypothetical protein
MSRRWHTAGLVLGGIAVGFLIGEAGLRWAFPGYRDRFRTYTLVENERGKFARYDSMLGWSGREDAVGTFEWLDCRHEVRQNRFGWRGPAYEPDQPKASRLLVLGDSFVWGFGVEEDQIFTRLLEGRSRIPLEVVNMGVSGYGTDQELLAFRSSGSRWRPDRVVLTVTLYTDLYDNVFAVRDGYPKPRFLLDPASGLKLTNVPVPPPKRWEAPEVAVRHSRARAAADLASGSAVLSLVLEAASRYPKVRVAFERQDILPPRLGGYDWEYHLYRRVLQEPEASAWSLLVALVRELRDAVEAQRASFAVFLVPSVVQVYPDLWESFARRAEGQALDPELPQRLVTERLSALGITVIDPLPALRAAGRRNDRLYFPVNRHWTAAGHDMAATVLLEGLGLAASGTRNR